MKWHAFVKGSTASALSLALIGFTGCNTIEGAGEDISAVGQAMGADQQQDYYYTEPAPQQSQDLALQQQDQQQQWVAQNEARLQSQDFDAGLYAQGGQQVSPIERQQPFGQQQQVPQQFGFDGQQQQQQQLQQQQTLSGTVSHIVRANGEVKQLTVKTDQGRQIRADLSQVQGQPMLRSGDRVVIQGQPQQLGDQTVFRASDVQHQQFNQTFGIDQPQQQQQQQQRQQQDWQKNQQQQQLKQQGQQGQAQDQQTFKATVQEVQKADGEIQQLTVKTQDGQTLQTDLSELAGPHADLNKGDEIVLMGTKEGNKLHVNRLRQAGEADVFGFAGGQAQTIQGSVQDVVKLQGKEGPHLVLQTKDGQEIVADLSQVDRDLLLGLNVEQGAMVTLKGEIQQKNGKQVLVAQEIRQDQGQQFNNQKDVPLQDRLQQDTEQDQQQ